MRRVSYKLRHRPSGYALAITVVLLAIVAVALVAAARLAARRATEADAQVREIQTRWALRSLEHALIPLAPALLSHAEIAVGRPLVSTDFRFDLAGQKIIVRVADEQAKFDVNHRVSDAKSAWHRAKQARDLLAGTAWSGLVRPRPIIASGLMAYPSPGHLLIGWRFDDLRKDRSVYASNDVITCSGIGVLNLRRAPPAVVRAWFAESLGSATADRLCLILKRSSAIDLTRCADVLQLAEVQRSTFLSQVSIESKRYSVLLQVGNETDWIVADDNGVRIQTLEFP